MGWYDQYINAVADVVTVGNRGRVEDALGMHPPGAPAYDAAGAAATAKSAREQDLDAGYLRGREMFYDDPDMQMLRSRRADLSQGYNGQELGALKGQASGELAGQREKILRDVGSKAARGGVGGARAAAIQGSVDNNLAKVKAEQDRKIMLDNANLKRTGTDSLQDFLFRQRFGQLTTGLGQAQLGVSDRTAANATAANQQDKDDKNWLENILGM